MSDLVQNRIKGVLMEQELVRKDAGLGLSTLQNGDIMLAGGMRSGNSPPGMTRLKYVIYDLITLKALVAKGVDHDKAYDQSISGNIQLFIMDGTDSEIYGISNIEVTQKKAGVGRRVIDALIADTEAQGRPLVILDVQKKAVGFWAKMGAEFFPDRNFPGEPLALDVVKKRTAFTCGVINRHLVSKDETSNTGPIRLKGFNRIH